MVSERLCDLADNQGLFRITAEQREKLQNWGQSRSLPAGCAFRARLILALGDGKTYREIEHSLGASADRIEMERSV